MIRASWAGNDTAQTVEDQAVDINVLNGDSDPNGDAPAVTIDKAPGNGQASLKSDNAIN